MMDPVASRQPAFRAAAGPWTCLTGTYRNAYPARAARTPAIPALSWVKHDRATLRPVDLYISYTTIVIRLEFGVNPNLRRSAAGRRHIESGRLASGSLPPEVKAVRPPVRTRREDGEQLEALLGELVRLLDRGYHPVLVRHDLDEAIGSQPGLSTSSAGAGRRVKGLAQDLDAVGAAHDGRPR